MESRVLTIREAALLLQVHEETVANMVRRGLIPARKVGRQWRLSEQAIHDWLAHRIPAPAEGQIPEKSVWRSGLGLLAGAGRPVEEFLKEKHAEIEQEEARFERWRTEGHRKEA
ncbi:MAG: helix-turn-helix domain-containing protein [Fimbriimonadia bacterium]|nr:helix-turn-helix domain-containing protein [Fimbriimonadia bacterium]